MFNFASLVAEEFLVQEVLHEGFSVQVKGHSILQYCYKNNQQVIDLEGLDWKRALRCYLYTAKYHLLEILRGRKPIDASSDSLTGLYFIEEEIRKSISQESYKEGLVSFIYDYQQFILPVNPEEYKDTYASLSLSRALLEGYKFMEVLGEHFIVYCPDGKIQVVKVGCDCSTYREKKVCLHQQCVNYLINNRSLCNQIAHLVSS